MTQHTLHGCIIKEVSIDIAFKLKKKTLFIFTLYCSEEYAVEDFCFTFSFLVQFHPSFLLTLFGCWLDNRSANLKKKFTCKAVWLYLYSQIVNLNQMILVMLHQAIGITTDANPEVEEQLQQQSKSKV